MMPSGGKEKERGIQKGKGGLRGRTGTVLRLVLKLENKLRVPISGNKNKIGRRSVKSNTASSLSNIFDEPGPAAKRKAGPVGRRLRSDPNGNVNAH